jgi:hypothetical protein
VDFARPVTVHVGGRRVAQATFRPDWSLAIQEAHRTRDRAMVVLGQVTADVK